VSCCPAVAGLPRAFAACCAGQYWFAQEQLFILVVKACLVLNRSLQQWPAHEAV